MNPVQENLIRWGVRKICDADRYSELLRAGITLEAMLRLTKDLPEEGQEK